jgi:autotransporter-associated beta strand protein
MRSNRVFSKILAGSASMMAFQTAASAATGPAYNIYPLASVGSNTIELGQGISTNGAYAAGMTQGATTSNAVLYNYSSNSSSLQSQSGILYYGSRNPTVENYGVPTAANNEGVLFGSSGTGVTALGQPSVWQNGQGYALPTPNSNSSAGQIYGANDLNSTGGGIPATEAVGTIGSPTGSLNQAAIFFYYGPNSSNNFTAALSSGSTAGGRLQDAFGINDKLQIVGDAQQSNDALPVQPFFLDFGANPTAQATLIPMASASYNSGIAFAISQNGLVTGTEGFNGTGSASFIYNSSSGSIASIPLPPNTGSAGHGPRGINDSGDVVGTASGAYAVPWLYDGTSTYDLQNLLANNTGGAWQLDNNTSSAANSISDNGTIVGEGYHNGTLSAFIMIPTGGTVTLSQILTFNNAGGPGDGVTWDTAQPNWNNGSGVTTFSSVDHDLITFNDVNNGNYNVSIPSLVTPGSITISNSAGNYIFNGAGGVGGAGKFIKNGTGAVTLNTVNSWTGQTTVDGGTLVLGVAGALPAGTNLAIAGNDVSNTSSYVIVKSLGTGYALQVGTLSLFQGVLDLQNNDLIVHSGTLSAVNALVRSGYDGGAWDGASYNSTTGVTAHNGIISSMAGAGHPLYALGTIVNDNGSGTALYGTGGTLASSFGGALPVDGDILVKFTYYGDANLDGTVDGSDYSLIDFSDLEESTSGTSISGWYNGDFNYDGVVDGSDYTLIDNAFNSQGASISTQLASSTAQVVGSGSAVPEPATAGVLGIGAMGLLARRRRA